MRVISIACLLSLAACSNPTHWNWAAVYSMRKTERQEANEWKRFSAAYAKHLEEKEQQP